MHQVFLLYALFASLFSISKSTLGHCEPFFFIGSRMAFAGLLMLAYELRKDPRSWKIIVKGWIPLTLLAIFNIYLTNIAEIWGIKHMISARACLLYSLSPFFSALFSYFLLKETLSPKKWMGLTIGFCGIIPATYQYITDYSGHSFLELGELSLLIAILSSVYGWILLQRVIKEYECTPFLANGFSMTLGGALALVHSYLGGESWAPTPVTNWQPFIINTLAMCVISNLVCYNLYGFLLKRYTATFMSFAGLVTPLFASLFGWLFLQESVSLDFFLSITFFSAGLFLFHQEEIAKEEFSIRQKDSSSPISA